DLEPFELTFVPVEKVEDLAAAGLFAGKPELAADSWLRFEKIDPMAAFGRHPRGFEPGGTGADDHDPSRGGGRRETIASPFEFAPRRGVDEAGNPVVAGASAPAHLVAGDAAADVLR